MPEPKNPDAIVIGSGLSGLICALLLARSGRRVLVVEQHPLPAPVVRGFTREGLYFDSGFHYAGGLGEGGAMRPLFCHLGLAEKLELFPFSRQGFDHLHIAASGESFTLPVGFSAIRSELIRRFPRVREQISAYLDAVEASWCRYPYLDLDTDLADFQLEGVHGESLAQQLQQFADYPQLQSLLSMHSLLYGVSPDQAPAALNAQVAGSYYHSVHGIVGGGRALVDALLDLLAAAGGEVRCRAEVKEILVSAAAVSGVRLASGETLRAREVVATLNPTLLPQLLPQGILRPAYLKRLKGLRQTSSAHIVFARSTRPLDFLERSNLFVQQRPGVFGAEETLPLEERAFYLSAARQAQDDRTALVGIVPAAYAEVAAWEAPELRHSADYAAHKEELATRLKNHFVRSCAQLEGLEIVDLATPLTLRDYSRAPAGAIYGVGRFLGQYNPQAVTRLPGLYLSGQAIAAPGLLGTMVSSYMTCGALLGHDALRGEIRKCR